MSGKCSICGDASHNEEYCPQASEQMIQVLRAGLEWREKKLAEKDQEISSLRAQLEEAREENERMRVVVEAAEELRGWAMQGQSLSRDTLKILAKRIIAQIDAYRTESCPTAESEGDGKGAE
jgi:predicted RNase H-like nuclease (RuvC/YqgF family)